MNTRNGSVAPHTETDRGESLERSRTHDLAEGAEARHVDQVPAVVREPVRLWGEDNDLQLHEIASVLLRIAKVIEPSHMRSAERDDAGCRDQRSQCLLWQAPRNGMLPPANPSAPGVPYP